MYLWIHSSRAKKRKVFGLVVIPKVGVVWIEENGLKLYCGVFLSFFMGLKICARRRVRFDVVHDIQWGMILLLYRKNNYLDL